MKKRTRLLMTAIMLLAVIFMQPLSTLSVYAAEASTDNEEEYEYVIPSEIIPKENVERYGHKERFYLAEESMNEIRILNEDGTVSAYTFGYPVKYVDDDGITKDKSNKLHESKRNNYLYVNDGNDIKTYFPKKITKKPIIIDKNGLVIEMSIVTDSIYSKKGVVTEDNYVFYEQAFGDNTAIQYKPDFNGYKEEIILYSEKAPTSYSFEIKCEDMYILKEDGILNFYSEFTDEVMFTTDPFYIYDSSEDVNSYVETEYTVTKTDDNEYLLTVPLNEEYLGTEGLTYPVYIDPAVKYNNMSYIDDVPLYSGIPNSNCGNDVHATVGYSSSLGVGRYLIRFNDMIASGSMFNSLTTNEIVSAYIYLYNMGTGGTSSNVYLYQFTGSPYWQESTATWSNIGIDMVGSPFGAGRLSYTATQYISFDVTSVVEGWKNNASLAQQGIMLVNTKEASSDTAYARCVITSKSDANRTPYMVINYTQIIPDGTYYIQNRRTKMYMETEGRSTTIGAAIQQGIFKTSNPAKWEIKRQYDGYYSIKSVVTGRYIGVENAATTNNAQVIQYQAYSKDDTKWAFSQSSSGNWIITAKKGADTNKVLSLPTTSESDGVNLVQYSYNNDEHYRDEWYILYTPGASIGDLNCWYSYENGNQTDEMGYWYYSPKVYLENYISAFSELSEYVDNAISQWNDKMDMDITRVSSQSSADIVVYGVDASKYYELTGDQWNQDLLGVTSIPQNPILGSLWAAYNGASKQIKVLGGERITIYILYQPQSIEQHTVTHEMGHALGYLGHSTNQMSIMHSGQVTSSSGITIEDSLYLSQVKGLVKVKIE